MSDYDDFRKNFKGAQNSKARAIELTHKYAEAVKAACNDPRKKKEVEEVFAKLKNEHERLDKATQAVCAKIGISLDDIDKILEQEIPEMDNRFDQSDILAAPTNVSLDDLIPKAVERLLRDVDTGWLEAESKKPFRLTISDDRSVVNIVGGRRIEPCASFDSPQRYAQALLICQDHVSKQPNLDFWNLPILSVEVALLGMHIELLPELGDQAVKKYDQLSRMDDEQVSSTLYELLVGIAGIKHGLNLEMLEESHDKTPDFRIHDLGVPTVAECKRKRVCGQLRREAQRVHSLFLALQEPIYKKGSHCQICLDFSEDIEMVSEKDLIAAIEPLLSSYDDSPKVNLPWGTLQLYRLPYITSLDPTRLFAPNYLNRVFGWNDMVWDGGVFAVDSPSSFIVSEARNPVCLFWRCRSEASMVKKARGVASSLGNAIKQVPDGEMGIIYLCYEEFGCEKVADGRTQRIIQESEGWYHRSSVNIPLVVLSRLYPRPHGAGNPDLIESSMPMLAGHADKSILAEFPLNVFNPTS